MLIYEKLNNILQKNREEIERWFLNHYNNVSPMIYSSVDIRNSGHKIVPVDVNLFPAGFNNVGKTGVSKAVENFRNYLGNITKILVISEANTRNKFYADNLYNLQYILKQCGYDVEFAHLIANNESIKLTTNLGENIDLKSIYINGKKELQTHDGYVPEVIILNNDLTEGMPSILNEAKQIIYPHPQNGWFQRKKSKNFEIYNKLAQEFASMLNFDPFYITTEFKVCEDIHFKSKNNLEKLASIVDETIGAIKANYIKHNMEDVPYVFIKSNKGTYGMGIITAYSGIEILEINKKARNKMEVIKGGTLNTEVVIQEGVKTIDKVENFVAEPMIYLVGGKVIDCILRVNSEHDEYGNLNSHGMSFKRDICEESLGKEGHMRSNCQYTPFSVVAKIATLASSYELTY